MTERRPSERSETSRRPRNRRKATDDIIDALRDDIADAVLAAGDRLPSERELAEQFGVSQPTVREAVRGLEAMGLVEARQGSGTFVKGDLQHVLASSLHTVLQMERVGILDVLELREVLGLHSAARGADHARPADLEAIEAVRVALDALGEADDAQTVAELAVAFQIGLSAAARNPLLLALETFLIKLIMQFQLAARRERGTSFWLEWAARFESDRRRLVECLRARDAEGVVIAMRAYLTGQRAGFASDRELTALRLSDPGALRAIADVTLQLPGQRS
jgi:GntR family transcriptional repressor for pyruvate dehydrogenase complex